MNDLVLAKLGTARTALVEAKTIQETKYILDIATAAEIYAKRQQLGEDAVLYATSIKVEALRQLGNMLKETQRNTGTRLAGSVDGLGGAIVEPPSTIPTLAELGLDKKISKLAQDIAALPDEQIEAVKDGIISVSRATQQKKQRDKKASVLEYTERVKDEPVLEKAYNVIFADPPWQYSTSINTLDAVTDSHYATMPIEKIQSYLTDMNISVADDAVLFLWVTNPFLVKALTVVDAWGFEYKTNIAWVKTELKKPGVGYYVRGRHELLFICTSGSFTPLDKSVSPPVGSVLESPVREHSQKPPEVYTIIESLYPGCTYLELFARDRRNGWDCLGNEA